MEKILFSSRNERDRFMKYILIIFTIFIISACKQNNASQIHIAQKADNNNYSVILNLNAHSELEIFGKANVDRINSIIANKKPLFRKIMPVFTMQLSIKVDNKKDTWLFAKPNFIMNKKKDNNQVFTIDEDLVQVFEELLQ